MRNKQVRVLLVEDDRNLGYLLKENFVAKGIDIQLARDGVEGLKMFDDEAFDLCICDIMLPKMDGFTLARNIRSRNELVPLIFLSAKSMEEDKFTAFDIGCDDYIVKPFSAQELYLRIKAILKRSKVANYQYTQNQIYPLGLLSFDYTDRRLLSTYKAIIKKLSTKEAELLRVFCEKKNTLISRSEILTAVWGTDDYFTAKSMDVYLTRLRKLLRDDPNLEIQNVHGTGFRLKI